MQSKIRIFTVAALSLSIAFTSCQKEKIEKNLVVENSTHQDDQSRVSEEMDAVNDEANRLVESDPTFSGRVATICDATVAVDTFSNPRTITITYNGASCLRRHTRTGVVVLSMPANARWKDAGATITISYQNLKITRKSDNNSITLNGTQTLTNVTGGRMFELPTLTNIIHTLSSTNMSIKFDDNTVRTWNVARKRVFTYNNGIVVTLYGNHSTNLYNNIEEWGTDRFGHPFFTAITAPIVVRQDCNFRITEGQLVHHRTVVDASVTFGLNASGNATGCPGNGTYYYKLTWTGIGGATQSVVLPY